MLCCGLISIIDLFLWAPYRTSSSPPKVVEHARGYFPILLIVLIIRSFLYQPFKIPSESLEPTLFPGDFILVNQYRYGLRLPVGHHKLTQGSAPKRGDIIVFRWPVSPEVNLVKRVIGVPGDEISYKDKVLTVNGIEARQTFVGIESEPKLGQMQHYREDLLGIRHSIYHKESKPGLDFTKFKVPADHYFVMGDNRDASDDSRYWGLVPESALIGQATRIWLSIDPNRPISNITKKLRTDRFWVKL